MSDLNVKCVDCKHAAWIRTKNGRIKKTEPGDCMAPPPLRLVALHGSWKTGAPSGGRMPKIWYDYEGQCDFFASAPKEAP